MKEKINIYNIIYKGVKTVILLIISSLIFLFSFAMTYTLINLVFSNFLDEDYEFSLRLFKGLNIKNVLLLVFLNFLVFLVLYVYKIDSLLYSGVFLYIMKGLSLFVILEIIMTNFYLPSFMSKGMSTWGSLKQALLFTNYKIGLSLLLIVFAYILILGAVFILDWYFLIFLMFPIYITQLLAKLILGTVKEEE